MQELASWAIGPRAVQYNAPERYLPTYRVSIPSSSSNSLFMGWVKRDGLRSETHILQGLSEVNIPLEDARPVSGAVLLVFPETVCGGS